MVSGITLILIGLVIVLSVRLTLQERIPSITQFPLSDTSILQPLNITASQVSFDSDLVVTQQLSDFDLLSTETPIGRP